MTRRTAPSPQAASDWREWAYDMVEYIQSRGTLVPQTVQLEHQLPAEIARATHDGLVMWEPTDERPLVSVDGQWVKLVTELDGGLMVTGDKFISRYADTTGDGTGSPDAVGDYSAATTDFKITAQPGQTLSLGRMIVSIEDTAGMAAADYGNIAGGLTNGITVLILDDVGGTLSTLTPAAVQTNGDWAHVCYDANVLTWGAGSEHFVVRWTFSNSGAAIQLNPGQSLCIRCADDLTGLLVHRFLVQGYEVDT